MANDKHDKKPFTPPNKWARGHAAARHQKYAEALRKPTETRPGEFTQLGECTVEDLRAAAALCYQRAAELRS